jgi:uncharacterized protein (TIGR02284 family)
MMTAPHHELARDHVARLIDVCHDGERLYDLASKGVSEPMLRAELAQYSAQRREFIEELHEAVQQVGEDLVEVPLPVPPESDALRRAMVDHDRSVLLAECERGEAAAVEAYRLAISAGLPYAVGGVVHTQFLAITRVQHRLHSLADAAREAAR